MLQLALFASTLMFDQHISNIVRRGNTLIAIINRTFSCLDQIMFQTLHTTHLNPSSYLDYASVVWNPYQLGHTPVLELLKSSEVGY